MKKIKQLLSLVLISALSLVLISCGDISTSSGDASSGGDTETTSPAGEDTS